MSTKEKKESFLYLLYSLINPCFEYIKFSVKCNHSVYRLANQNLRLLFFTFAVEKTAVTAVNICLLKLSFSILAVENTAVIAVTPSTLIIHYCKYRL